MEHSKRMKKGFEVLRKMGRLGTMMNQQELYPDLYDLSVGYLFGEIWTRPHLSLRDRELITLASNIALARPDPARYFFFPFFPLFAFAASCFSTSSYWISACAIAGHPA